MKTNQIVIDNLYKELMTDRFDEYKNVLREGNDQKTIHVYREAIHAFQKLSADDQNALCNFFKVVTVDAISVVLGGIDGTGDIGELSESFVLTYAGESIQGELQDKFLALVEASGLLRR